MSEKSDTNPSLTAEPANPVETEEPSKEKKTNEKVTCRCGKTVSKKQYNGHLNSGSHIKAMKELVDAKKELNEIKPNVTVETPKKENGAKLFQLLAEMNKKLEHLIEMSEDIANAIFEDDEDLMEPDIPCIAPSGPVKKITTKKSKTK